MTLVTYTPNRTANAKHLNRVMNYCLHNGEHMLRDSNWSPRIDARETEEALMFTLDLPGVKKEAVSITVKDDTLKISGSRSERDDNEQYFHMERGTGTFEREFALLTKIDADKITATLADGVLEVVLPKAEQAKPREIEIQ